MLQLRVQAYDVYFLLILMKTLLGSNLVKTLEQIPIMRG